MAVFVTPEELLGGSDLRFDVEIPADVLYPSPNGESVSEADVKSIRLRPLNVRDVQRIAKAAKDDEVLTSVLMIQMSSEDPKLEREQVAGMNSGLVRFLVDSINRISGLTTNQDEIRALAEAPLMRAFFTLSREFNWTPDQLMDMTLGQILGYLETLNASQRKQLDQ